MKRRHSQKRRKPFLLAMLLVLAYLLGVAAGVAVIGGVPAFSDQKEYLFSYARKTALQYTEDPEAAGRTNADAHKRIFDAGGSQILDVPPAVPWLSAVPDDMLRRYLPAVLTGKELYRGVYLRELNDVVVVAAVPLREGDSVTGAVFIMRNLKNVPEAVEAYLIFFTVFFWLSAYFILSAERRKQKLEKLQENYVANMTHALKAPIASIKALAETLSDDMQPDPDRRKVYYGVILREASIQERMVLDVLELSKIQNGGMDFTRGPVEAGEIFAGLREKYETLCECAGVTFRIRDAAAALPMLDTNAACINQVLGILMDNALKFVDEAGEICIDASVSKRRAVICVRDDGCGIGKEDLPHVFERFYRGSGKRSDVGSGLGLAIAKEIMDGLKEKIWVESTLGHGASFYFTVRFI